MEIKGIEFPEEKQKNKLNDIRKINNIDKKNSRIIPCKAESILLFC